MSLVVMNEKERAYAYTKDKDIQKASGAIGYLRADMDTDGTGFFSSWNDFNKELKTQGFKDEFDEIINELREEGNILQNRAALAKFCYSHPESDFGSGREFGIRVDTKNYVYLMRLNPHKGEYNLYCYCYVKSIFDNYLKESGVNEVV